MNKTKKVVARKHRKTKEKNLRKKQEGIKLAKSKEKKEA